MTTPKFTPGPWRMTEEPDSEGTFFAIRNNRGYLIATTATYDLTKEREANASLIASAPALYAALRELIEICEWAKLDYPETWQAVLRESYGMKGDVFTEIADQKHSLSVDRIKDACAALALARGVGVDSGRGEKGESK